MFIKRFLTAVTTAILLAGIVSPVSAAFAATPTNLINDPLVSTADPSNPGNPLGWSQGSWGTNTTSFSYQSTGFNDSNSLKVSMTSYTSGDAKWYFTPVAVSANTSYTFSDYFTSTVATDVVVQLDNGSGVYTYQDLGPVSAASNWTPYSASFTTASDTKNVTVFHLINSVGSLTTDDFSLSTTVTTPPPPPPPPSSNLVANPSVETASSNPSLPANWNQGGWGTNTASFNYLNTGHTGSHSLNVAISSYTNGDAKWYFNPVAVSAGTSLSYSDYYESNVTSDVVAQFDNGSGTYSYQDLGTVPASSTWATFTDTFTVPTGMKNVTVFHLLNSVGSLTTDDFSLTIPTTPTIAISTTATNPVKGTIPLTATVTNTSSVQFQVDGANVGSPITTTNGATPTNLSYSFNTTTVADGAHTVTAVATGTGGQTTSSNTLGITVGNNSVANLIPNPLVAVPSSTNANTPANWSIDNWGTNKATFSWLNSGYNDSHSLKVSMTSYTSGDGKWSFDPINVTPDTQYKFSEYYKSNVNTQIDAVFNMSDGSTDYEIVGLPQSGSNWQQFATDFSIPSGTQSMTIYHFIQSVGTLQTDDFSLIPYTPVGFNRAVVSLTFDDGYDNEYTQALPLLNKYGFHSTQFIITDLIGQSGYMTSAQVIAMNKAGNEMASHTVTHNDLTQESTSTLTNELSASKTQLGKWSAQTPTDLAYPYGLYNNTVVSYVKQYYTAARGVEDGLNSKDNWNPYDIKVQNIYDNTTTAQVADWVKQAQMTNTWLVFVYHSVNPDTSAGLYNVTPTQLDSQLSAIKASGVTVETMQQAFAETSAQIH